jgi:hypothetical protein
MQTTRRQFLQAGMGTASLLGLADPLPLRGLVAMGAEPPAVAETVRFGPDIEPIVRLIEETPQARCVPVLIDQLRRGLPYRRFLAAVFWACIRKHNSHHEVYQIPSVHQISQDLRDEEKLLPLFWAVDIYKRRQEVTAEPALPVLKGTFPSPEQATAEFRDGMQAADRDRSERALVALARHQGARQVAELLWPYACSNVRDGGHRAIAVVSCCRALDTIGWQEAEPALRFAVRDLHSMGAGQPDVYFPANTARVNQNLEKLPAGWAGGSGDQAATLELFALIRAGQTEPACDLVVKQLLRGTAAQSTWDAVHLAAADLMVRHNSGWGVLSRPLHSKTTTNALHYAFRTSSAARTRFLVLLQSVAWVAHNARASAGDSRDIQLTRLPATALPAADDDAVAEVFALLPSRTYRWDAQAKKAITTYGQRADADLACRKVFALASERPAAALLYAAEARRWLCRKASADTHDYKFPAAILEDVEWVSPAWRPHLLAASVHWLHGKQSPDAPVVEQAREALQQKT